MTSPRDAVLIVALCGAALFGPAVTKPDGYSLMGWHPKPKPPPVMAPPPEQLAPIVRPAPPKAKPKPKPKAKPKPKQPPAGVVPPQQQRPTAAQCAKARTWIRRIGREAVIVMGMAYPPGFTRAEVERGLKQCGL